MGQTTEADRYLLDQVRAGSADGWEQLVARYQGRLTAFARLQLANPTDADDVVQETFVSFLTGLGNFRHEASVETYLFSILRRKIVDQIRSRGRQANLSVCTLQDSAGSKTSSASSWEAAVPALEPAASWYARKDEEQRVTQDHLWQALQQFLDGLKSNLNFRDLKICELVFYAQIRNKEIASQTGMDEKQIALLKHRFIQRIIKLLGRSSGVASAETPIDEHWITRFWEQNRPSCPKRSTIGKFHLGTLDDAWHDYIDFHIHSLGCRFCHANLEDLRAQSRADNQRMSDRVFQSTIGFLKRLNN